MARRSFTSEEIDSAIAALDDDTPWEGRNGSLWYELGFMEKHGFDIREYRGHIRQYIRGFEAPFEHDPTFDDPAEQELMLELRDILRKQAGLPPLTKREREAWTFWHQVYPAPRTYDSKLPTGTILNDIPKPTDAQREAVADVVEANYPEVVRYIQLAFENNKGLGFNGGPNNKKILRSVWVGKYINNAIHDVLKDIPGLHAGWIHHPVIRAIELRHPSEDSVHPTGLGAKKGGTNMNMSIRDGVAPLIAASMFSVLAGLRVTWHQSALIPGICAALCALRAFINMKKQRPQRF